MDGEVGQHLTSLVHSRYMYIHIQSLLTFSHLPFPSAPFQSQSTSSKQSRKRGREVCWEDIDLKGLNPAVIKNLSIVTPYYFYQLTQEKKNNFVALCSCPSEWVAVLEERIATVSVVQRVHVHNTYIQYSVIVEGMV